MFHWALQPRPCRQKKGTRVKKTLDEKAVEGNKIEEAKSFICLLTSSLVYQWCVSEEQSRPGAAESSVVSHFCSAAGDQRVGETEGNNRLRRKGRRRGESRTEGICWIIVYSVVVLTSEWTPADTGPWRLAHVDTEKL